MRSGAEAGRRSSRDLARILLCINHSSGLWGFGNLGCRRRLDALHSPSGKPVDSTAHCACRWAVLAFGSHDRSQLAERTLELRDLCTSTRGLTRFADGILERLLDGTKARGVPCSRLAHCTPECRVDALQCLAVVDHRLEGREEDLPVGRHLLPSGRGCASLCTTSARIGISAFAGHDLVDQLDCLRSRSPAGSPGLLDLGRALHRRCGFALEPTLGSGPVGNTGDRRSLCLSFDGKSLFEGAELFGGGHDERIATSIRGDLLQAFLQGLDVLGVVPLEELRDGGAEVAFRIDVRGKRLEDAAGVTLAGSCARTRDLALCFGSSGPGRLVAVDLSPLELVQVPRCIPRLRPGGLVSRQFPFDDKLRVDHLVVQGGQSVCFLDITVVICLLDLFTDVLDGLIGDAALHDLARTFRTSFCGKLLDAVFLLLEGLSFGCFAAQAWACFLLSGPEDLCLARPLDVELSVNNPAKQISVLGIVNALHAPHGHGVGLGLDIRRVWFEVPVAVVWAFRICNFGILEFLCRTGTELTAVVLVP